VSQKKFKIKSKYLRGEIERNPTILAKKGISTSIIPENQAFMDSSIKEL
jgi:hypothetical protein